MVINAAFILQILNETLFHVAMALNVLYLFWKEYEPSDTIFLYHCQLSTIVPFVIVISTHQFIQI